MNFRLEIYLFLQSPMELKNQLRILEKECQNIVIDPENNLNLLNKILDEINNPLSLPIYLKIFQSILPLYKIKIIEDRVKHSKEYERLKDYDKQILDCYRKYIQFIIKYDEYEAFKSASELLISFDHFNYVEKLIVKILKGTLHYSKEVQNLCHKTIEQKFKICNEISYKFLIQMMDLKYHPSVLFYTHKIKKNETDLKITNKNEEALLRLYLYILRNKEIDFYLPSIQGLKYCNLKKELIEGVLILLNEILETCDDSEILISTVQTTAHLFSNETFSLTSTINKFIEIIKPFQNLNISTIIEITDLLFIQNRQPPSVVDKLIYKLIQLILTEYSKELVDIIKRIKSKYQINTSDFDEKFYMNDLYEKIYLI